MPKLVINEARLLGAGGVGSSEIRPDATCVQDPGSRGEDEEGSDDSGSEEREELTLEEAQQLLDARAADKKRSGKKART
eukprot:1147703-Pelagomonas_calceolata.AAC.2